MARLTGQDWVDAAFRALTDRGPEAVKVEPLARALGSSKGSFYWHFADLAALKSAMLNFWQTAATASIIEVIEAGGASAEQRLEALLEHSARIPEAQGGIGVEPAIRDWAQADDEVAARLKKVDDVRLTYLQTLFEEMGLEEPKPAAELFYACHLGCEQMARSGTIGSSAPAEIMALLRHRLLA